MAENLIVQRTSLNIEELDRPGTNSETNPYGSGSNADVGEMNSSTALGDDVTGSREGSTLGSQRVASQQPTVRSQVRSRQSSSVSGKELLPEITAE